MNRLVLVLAAAGVLALAGCATADPGPGPTPPQGASLPAIEITRTGGFAGVHETLSVGTDGRWAGSAGAGELSPAARARLTAILTDPALPEQIAAAPAGRCCDMFQYELRVGAQTYHFGEPDLGPLLTGLLDVLREQTGF
jgi:hypothetical protein